MSTAGRAPVFGPGGGGGAGGGTTGTGGSGYAGQVELIYSAAAAPNTNILRFLLAVPSGGDTNNAVVAQYKTNGSVATCVCTYTTASSGTLVMTGLASGGSTLFTSSAITSVNGKLLLVSMELDQNGSAVKYTFEAILPGGTSNYASVTGSIASSTIGTVSEVDIDPNSNLNGSAVGHVVVQYALEALTSVSGAMSGWSGERAGVRFQRLCTEQGIAYEFLGNTSDTPSMGPQPDDTPMNVFQQIEDLDRGLLFEPRDMFGLGYRTWTDMTNQTPAIVVDYSQQQISQPFQPTEDDQLTRNDVTVSRTNGSSVIVQQTTGPMSISAIGDYTYSITVNAHVDGLLSGVASIILSMGTVDDNRYPQVSFDLRRPEVASIYDYLSAASDGDYLQIINPPSFLTPLSINQLLFGFNETLNGVTYTIQYNCVPESPFEV